MVVDLLLAPQLGVGMTSHFPYPCWQGVVTIPAASAPWQKTLEVCETRQLVLRSMHWKNLEAYSTVSEVAAANVQRTLLLPVERICSAHSCCITIRDATCSRSVATIVWCEPAVPFLRCCQKCVFTQVPEDMPSCSNYHLHKEAEDHIVQGNLVG